MSKYVLRTRLLERPDVVFYYKGTADESGVPLALNTTVAFDISDALLMDEDHACSLRDELNMDKESLLSTGYALFEVVPCIPLKS